MEEPALNWYAMKVFYNKVFELEDLLQNMDVTTYLAASKVQLKGEAFLAARKRLTMLFEEHKTDNRFIVEGPFIYQMVPMVTSLLFFRTTPEMVADIDKMLWEASAMGKPKGFIYKSADRTSFAVIPDAQMAAFRLVTESGASGLEFFADDDLARFAKGTRVRVVDGPLKGAEGYIKRIRRDRRLLVCIEGIIAVATSYIDPKNLQKI